MGDHSADLIVASLTLILVYIDIVITNCASVSGHLQLFVNLEHNQLQFAEEILVEKMLLEFFEDISS